MDVLEKAKILTNSGNMDSCGPKMCKIDVEPGLGGIYHAKANHQTCRLFKTLMDNKCAHDCHYCSNSSNCKNKKVSYEPKELVDLFSHLNKNLAVDGLFLSSGVSGNADRSTEKMIEAVKMLRVDRGFKGYIHLKVLPGVSRDLVKQGSLYANRMSINIEAPSSGQLNEISSCKDYKIDILRRQAWVKSLGLSGGQSTQMILTQNSTDKDVLRMVDWEYDKMKLRRVYYSSFKPVKGTIMQNVKEQPLFREQKLYNIDFLVRDYNYKFKEFNSIMDNGMLPNSDPKLELAKLNYSGRVDVNEASYEELIRIPGIGPTSAKRIVENQGKILRFAHLDKLGATLFHAKPFINVNGIKQCSLAEF